MHERVRECEYVCLRVCAGVCVVCVCVRACVLCVCVRVWVWVRACVRGAGVGYLGDLCFVAGGRGGGSDAERADQRLKTNKQVRARADRQGYLLKGNNVRHYPDELVHREASTANPLH